MSYVGGFAPEVAKPDTNLINFDEPDSPCGKTSNGSDFTGNHFALRNNLIKNSSPYRNMAYGEATARPQYAEIGGYPLVPQIQHCNNENQPHCSKVNNGNEFIGNNFNQRNHLADSSSAKINNTVPISANDILLNSREMLPYWPDIDDLSTSFSDIIIS